MLTKREVLTRWSKLVLLIIISLISFYIPIIDKDIANAQPRFTLDPSKAALIVVDMQNDFVREGSPIYGPAPKKTIETHQKLINACRERGVPIFFTQFVRPPVKTIYREYMSHYVEPPHNICMRGLKRYYTDVKKELETIDIIEELSPKPEDFLISRPWYDSFVDSPLDSFLRALGRKYVIITGTTTDGCVEATARGAYFKQYYTTVVSDATSASAPEQHNFVLTLLSKRYVKVMTTDEVISELKK